jgi:hypothetical protein
VYCANVLAGDLCRISFIISEFSFAVNVVRGARIVTRAGKKYMRKRVHYTYKRNTEARSSDHCYSGKAMSFTYLECVCVCVALGTQHAMRMRHIVICGLRHSTIFLHIISQTAGFSKKITEHKMSSLNSSTSFV